MLRFNDAVDLTVNLTQMTNEKLTALRDEALTLAQQNYQPPSPEQVDAQERSLYGEDLYYKAQQQMQSAAMQEHRRRHGFNENAPNENLTNKAV